MSKKVIVGPEDLTPLQRKYLRNMRDYCDSPPTFATICAKAWRYLFRLVLIAAIAVCAGILLDRPVIAWFNCALVLGALLANVGYFRQTVQLWPAIRAITDRKRLEELLGEPPDDNYS